MFNQIVSFVPRFASYTSSFPTPLSTPATQKAWSPVYTGSHPNTSSDFRQMLGSFHRKIKLKKKETILAPDQTGWKPVESLLLWLEERPICRDSLSLSDFATLPCYGTAPPLLCHRVFHNCLVVRQRKIYMMLLYTKSWHATTRSEESVVMSSGKDTYSASNRRGKME